MSEYQNVVWGRLKLKGKALDVKEGGVKKKKKKKHQLEESSQIEHNELQKGFFFSLLHWPILDLSICCSISAQLDVLISITMFVRGGTHQLLGCVHDTF